ncbi:MAG: DUF6680 family protein [Sulfuricaulis sp.]
MQIDWSIVFATIAGPILAVWASEWRQQRRALHERKEKVFHTLMSTRAARLRIEHVGALNQIEYAFPRKSCAAIQDAWGLYLRHLRAPESASQDLAIRTAWNVKATDLLSELLYLMAVDLKLPYSRSEIKDNSYYPDAYVSDEIDLIETKKHLLQVLKDGRPINIRVIQDVQHP